MKEQLFVEKSEETTFKFSQNAATVVTQKIVNLLHDANS